MQPRTRKLVGTLAVVLFLAVYIWLASLLAARLPSNQWAQLAFFAVAGIAWGFPLFPLISWMQRGSR
jgi:hypothetical protein